MTEYVLFIYVHVFQFPVLQPTYSIYVHVFNDVNEMDMYKPR